MENKISVISIIIENLSKVNEVNSILHQYNDYIIGRMGLPYKQKNISIISVVLDAPSDITSSISGKIGMLEGVTSKTNTAKF